MNEPVFNNGLYTFDDKNPHRYNLEYWEGVEKGSTMELKKLIIIPMYGNLSNVTKFVRKYMIAKNIQQAKLYSFDLFGMKEIKEFKRN